MSSLSGTWASFGRSERILAAPFGAGFVLAFLLTPQGSETRMDGLRSPAFAVFFVTVGLLLPLAGLVALLLRRRPRLAGALAVIGASLLFFTPPADQALGFDRISLHQVGPGQGAFFEFSRDELLPALR